MEHGQKPCYVMSLKSKQAGKRTGKKAPKKSVATKARDFSKLFSAAVKAGSTSFADSNENGTGARHGFASHDRTDGKHDMSAKRNVFEYACSVLKKSSKLDAAMLVAYAKAKKLTSVQTGEPIKASTLRSWLANWKRGIAGGAFYPCEADRKTEIEKLFKKISK